MNPLVQVCSHKRSGTHLLMRTLWENFYQNRTDLVANVTREQKTMGAYSGYPIVDGKWLAYGRLWKSHNPTPPVGERLIYIFRDGRDVALSLRRFRNKAGTEHWYRDVFDYWRRHVEAYIRSTLYVVRYESLIERPRDILRGITQWFALDAPAEYVTVTDAVGWKASGDHRIRKWKQDMPERVQAIFDDVVPPGHPGRFD